MGKTCMKFHTMRMFAMSEFAEHLQFHTLSSVDANFIDANLRRRFADRLFKVDVSPKTVELLGMKTNYVYIFVLIDHKSTDEPYTLVHRSLVR